MLRVEENHYKRLPYHQVKARLFEGKHKMYKVEDTEGLNKWLKMNRLPQIDEPEDENTKDSVDEICIT